MLSMSAAMFPLFFVVGAVLQEFANRRQWRKAGLFVLFDVAALACSFAGLSFAFIATPPTNLAAVLGVFWGLGVVIFLTSLNKDMRKWRATKSSGLKVQVRHTNGKVRDYGGHGG